MNLFIIFVETMDCNDLKALGSDSETSGSNSSICSENDSVDENQSISKEQRNKSSIEQDADNLELLKRQVWQMIFNIKILNKNL